MPDNEYLQFYQKGIESENKGNLDDAILFFKKSASLNNQFESTFNHLGLIFSRQGNRKFSIQCFEKAVNLKPSDKSWYNLGVEHYKSGDENRAVQCLEKSVKLNPKYTESYLLLAHIHRHLDQDDISEKYLANILKYDKTNRFALAALVVIKFDNEAYDGCEKIAARFLELYPDDSRIRLLHADLLMKKNDYATSLKELKELAKTDPGFKKFNESIKKEDPAQKEFFQELGSRVDKKADEFEAKEELYRENPEDFSPPDAQDALDLSLLHLFNGNTDKAMEYLVYANKSINNE